MHWKFGTIPDYVGPVLAALVAIFLGYVGLIRESRNRRADAAREAAQNRADAIERDRQVRREHHGEELRQHLNAITAIIGHPRGLDQPELLAGLYQALRQLQVIGETAVVAAAAEVADQFIALTGQPGIHTVDLDALATSVRDNVRSQLGLDAIEVSVPFRNLNL